MQGKEEGLLEVLHNVFHYGPETWKLLEYDNNDEEVVVKEEEEEAENLPEILQNVFAVEHGDERC